MRHIMQALGDLKQEAGDYARAQHWYDQALVVMPHSHELLLRMGNAASANGQLERASSALSIADHIEPHDTQTLAALGYVQRRLGNFEASGRLLQEVVTRQPSLDTAQYDLALSFAALSLYAYASAAFDAWQQRPLLKAHVDHPPVLRIGPPWLEASLLRELPEHFATATTEIQLTPAHEGEGRPLAPGETGTPEQQQFDYLGRLRNANLVTTQSGRAHYWVAMESGAVWLTPLGRYFWGLAKRKVL